MNAVPFDTLKLARGLEAAGLTPSVAAGTAAALAEALTSTDLATKSDLALLEARMNQRFDAQEARTDARFDAVDARFGAVDARVGAMEANTNARFDAMEANTNARFDAMEANTNARFDAMEANTNARFDAAEARTSARFAALEASIELLRRDMTIKLGSMMLVAVGVILAAIRFMPHP